MNQSSIKKNFLMNTIRIFSNVIYPLITFPYISRILLTEGVGKVSFAQGITNYFLIFSSLGISIYGIRAIAKVRENKERLTFLVFELLSILLISTIISFSIYITFIYMSPKLFEERELFYIMSLSLYFTNIGVEWFYQGMEEYSYITARNIFFKVISLFLLVVFVKEESDYINYVVILVLSMAGNGILNFINLRKFIFFEKSYFRNLNLRKHFKPIMLALVFSVAASVYVNLDTVMLGYLSDNRAVGLYTASVRITKIVVTLVTSLGGVLIPRVSYYVEKGLIDDLKRIISMSSNFTLMFALPSMVGLFILAPEVIYVIAGNDFADSVVAMRILLPIIFFLGYSNLIGMQILYPYGKEKIVIISVIVGAMVNFILNVTLIPIYRHNGAAISTMLAEGIVLLIQIILARELIGFLKPDNNSTKILISTIIMAIVLLLIPNIALNIYISIVLNILIGGGTYLLGLIILKETYTIGIVQRILKI